MSTPRPAACIERAATRERVFPFALRWHADALLAAAALRLAQPQPWQAAAAVTPAAANSAAVPMRATARLHRYQPAAAAALFRIR